VSGLPILRAPQRPCPGSLTIAHASARDDASRICPRITSRPRGNTWIPPEIAPSDFIPDTNPIESPFAAVRLRTTAAKRFKRVENATAVIWKTLLVAEQTFRRLDAPELLAEVAEGVTYVNGVRVKPSQPTTEEKAAA
jgi:hypothetical protein